MKRIVKYAAAITLTGALAVAAAAPTQAAHGRKTAAAIGFGDGALAGAAANAPYNSSYYYGPGYGYYGPGYAYQPGYSAYAFEPGYSDGSTYGPRYSFDYGYRDNVPSCATDLGYGRFDYRSC